MRALPRLKLLSRWGLGATAGTFLLLSCGAFRTAGPSGSGPAESAGRGAARIERRELSNHPPISLVLRLGDPQPSVAFATAHDSGAVASVALSALILSRLQVRGISDVASIPTQGGVTLAALAPQASSARAFIEGVTAALATAIADTDPALSLIQEHLGALRSRTFAGRGEAALAACSGELGLPAGTPVPDVRTPAGRQQVDNYRRFAFASRASAFAALGSAAYIDAAAVALENTVEWPSGDAPSDAWPSSDVVETDAVDGARHLSVALRLPDADGALSSLPPLSDEHAPFATRLRGFLPGYAVARVAFQARPRGACLRVDLRLPDADPAPSAKELAQAAKLVSEEIRAAQSRRDARGALDENAIEPSDPRQAAARAAWRALSAQQAAGAPRRVVAASVHPAERPSFNSFGQVLNEVETRPARAPLEVRLRAEPGQGQLWLLLGSPCGTLAESNDDAGQSALALTLAARASTADVSLEPWLTSDAVGLLAHAARKPFETPTEQAERIARALAQALTERDLSGGALAVAQSELFTALGGAPRPGYARLLDALSPEHSAWLEPRGTWASVALANRDSVAARARDLLRGPLRVAVLGNEDEAQARAGAEALERWFAPWRDDPRRCQTSSQRSARSGELSLAIVDSSANESAYFGVSFPSRLDYELEAEAFVTRLNAADGPLSRALAAEHLSAAAEAKVVGGGRAAALVVELHATDDEARPAVLVVRRVLDRLTSAPWGNEDFARVLRETEQRALGSALNPRRRIVDLWRGTAAEHGLSRSSLRAFQAALGASTEVVVYVMHRD